MAKNLTSAIALLILFNFQFNKLDAQIVNIPDANFKAALLAHSPVIDSNNDGEIQVSEAHNFTGTLLVSGKNIVNLHGIEAFISLTVLKCANNKLTSLDLIGNEALTDLWCFNNELTSINLTANSALTTLYANSNKLTSLDLTTNTSLITLTCVFNQLSSLNLAGNTALTGLNCWHNQLSSLDLTTNTALIGLNCSENQLSSIDLTANTALIALNCSQNQLSSLGLATNTALIDLNCTENQLSSLDLTANNALTYLSCGGNQIVSLDLTSHPALTTLYCYKTKLTSLDLRANTALLEFYCNNTPITSIDLRNGNNTALLNDYLSLSNNPNLICISVDNPVWSANNWTNKDLQSKFSNDCSCASFATVNETVCSTYSAPDGKVHSSSGTYIAIIPNASNCDSIITIKLVVNNPNISSITKSVCETFTAPDGQVITKSGTYQSIIPNPSGCDSVITIYLTVNPAFEASLIEVWTGGEVQAYPVDGDNYEWFRCMGALENLSFSGSVYPDAMFNDMLQVIVSRGACTDTSDCTLLYLEDLDEYLREKIKLYPNPTDGLFHVDLGQIYSNVTIKITDLQGREIKREEAANQRHFEVELNEAAGIYLVHVLSDKQELSVIRLVKN